MDESAINREATRVGHVGSLAYEKIRETGVASAASGVIADRLEHSEPGSVAPKNARLFPNAVGLGRVDGVFDVGGDQLDDRALSRDASGASSLSVDADLPVLDELARLPAAKPEMDGHETVYAICGPRYDESCARFYFRHAAA